MKLNVRQQYLLTVNVVATFRLLGINGSVGNYLENVKGKKKNFMFL